MRLLVLHGPNLDLLGTREPEIYGSATLTDVTASLEALATELGATLEHFQSAHEGELVQRLHQAMRDGVRGVLVNPAAYTHTSVALRDAFLATGLPFVEVHLSNTAAREEFRRRSLLADVAMGTVAGFGVESYLLGLRGLISSLSAA